jgi:hypothetical protein
MDQEVPSTTIPDQSPTPEPAAERPWVKPVFQRIPLNEAANNSQTIGTDGISTSGS